MARLFVFGIGGTGARVLRSLTMRMASGVEVGVDEICPILIDKSSVVKSIYDTAAAPPTISVISLVMPA